MSSNIDVQEVINACDAIATAKNQIYKNLPSEIEKWIAKYEAMENAHKATLDWFRVPSIRINQRCNNLSVCVAQSLDTPEPMEYIKHRMVKQLAEQLLTDGLVKFDVHDSGKGFHNDGMMPSYGKIYKATVQVVY
jgi:hypothetical protein